MVTGTGRAAGNATKRDAGVPHGDGFDRLLLARTRVAIDRWESETEFGPTSSLTGGGAIEAFETRFAPMCGASHALGISSGTLALRTALAAVGVGPGTSVVIPAFDWPAAAAAVMSLGARPVPADVRAESFLLDPDAARKSLDRSTRAVIVTHLAGVPADTDKLKEVCNHAGVVLIEDCCQAFGAMTGGQPVGTTGAVGVFSLGPGKLVDAGEGGVLVTDNDEIFRAAVRLTQHPTRQLRTGVEPNPLALAARLHPVAAIMAFAALDDVGHELSRRRATAERLVDLASHVVGVNIPSELSGRRFSWPCTPAVVQPQAIGELRLLGVGCEPLGGHDITQLVKSGKPTPNAHLAALTACRLYELSNGLRQGSSTPVSPTSPASWTADGSRE